VIGSSSGHWPLILLQRRFFVAARKVYDASAQSCMLHGSEMALKRKKNEMALYRTEMRMIR